MPPIELATLATVQAAILDMLSSTEPTFLAAGIRIAQSIILIRLVWFGVMTSLNHHHYGATPVGEFIELIFTLVTGYALTTFYASPLPVLGTSFSNLIPSMAQWCANALDSRALETTFYALDALGSRFAVPTVWAFLINALYWGLLVLLAFTKAVALIVIIGPAICVGVLLMFGPIFCAFYVAGPVLDWLFFSWLKSLLVASFCQPVAMAYLLVMSKFLNRLVLTWPDTIPPASFALYVGELGAFLLAFSIGTLMIPKLAGSLFGSGSAHSVSLGLGW